MAGMWLWGFLAVVLLLVFAVLLMRSLLYAGGPGGIPGPERETPEQILKRRFAAGEIEAEEYRKRLEELRK